MVILFIWFHLFICNNENLSQSIDVCELDVIGLMTGMSYVTARFSLDLFYYLFMCVYVCLYVINCLCVRFGWD